MKRPLNPTEKQQLRIQKAFHERRLRIGWKFKATLYAVITILLSILLIYFLPNYEISWVGIIAFPLAIIYIYFNIKNQLDDFKKSKERLKQINPLLASNDVEIQRFKCRKAIIFPEYEDESICYALEIAKNQLLFWWDYEHTARFNLPNTLFETYTDKSLLQIFHTEIYPLGERFQPIVIDPEIKWEIADILPGHRHIIDSNVDNFLNQIEIKLTKP
ncbi:MAG: hypothetical protein AB8G22_06895 [Saprospiraceae bacterium]